MHPTFDGSLAPRIVPLDHGQKPAGGGAVPVDHGTRPDVGTAGPGTAEHTDQAHAQWQQAELAADNAPPSDYGTASTAREKREAFEEAIRVEIETLPDFIGPISGDVSRIEAKTGPVFQRYADDSVALELVHGVVGELEALQPLAQRPDVSRLLDQAAAQPDAEAVVDTLAEGLEGLSESDRAYLTTSPELSTLLREKVEPWVSEPYAGLGGDALLTATAAANEASRRLQVLTDGLPPDLAYGVVLGNLDTIQQIAQLKPMYLGNPSSFGGEAFGRLSDAAAALGDTPEGQALRTDIATLFVAGGVDRGQGGPLATVMGDAVRNGASPALALEMIRQLPGVGEGELAGVATTKLIEAGESLAGDIAGDLEDYNAMLAGLGILLKRNEGLPAAATDAAVEAWLADQDPTWQSEFEALEGRLVERAEVMRELLAGVSALPDDLRAPVEGDLKDLFNREDVLNAVSLAASRDRGFLTGPEADLMIALADPARAGAAGADTLRQIGNHAIQQQASLIFANLEHGNAASASVAKAGLQSLGDRVAGLFGGDAEAYRQAMGALDGFADLPANATPAQVEAAATRLDSALGRIEGFGSDSAPGVLMRSLGVAAGVLALNKYASQAIDDPTLRDQVATLGAASGLGSATIALLQRPGSVDVSGLGALDDARGRLGPLGAANWSRALGVFSAVGDVAYMIDAIDRGDGVEAGLHGLAGAGTVVLSVASGPVGWVVGGSMIALSMFGQASLAQYHAGQDARTDSIDFLVAAGLERDVAELLADTGETQGGPAVPAVPLILETARFGGLVGSQGERLTSEQTIEALNAMSGDPDQLKALQAQVNQLRYANQHLLMGGG